MRIHCPQCDYERHVDDDKLPASACMATCPKCAHRFNFRECVAAECAVEPASPACTLPQEKSVGTATNTDAQSALTTDAPTIKTPAPSETTPSVSEAPASPKKEQNPDPKNMWDDLSSTVNRWDSKQNCQRQTSQQQNFQDEDTIIPWENLGVYNFFQGLILTIKLAATSPASFFGKMVGNASLSRPLTFFVILGIFQAVMERLWYATLANTITSGVNDPQLQQLFESVSHDTNIFVTLLVSPFMLTLQVFIITGLYYLMFRFVRPDKANFKVLFRVMSYAAAPTVICVIPVLGPVVANFIYLAWTIIGCKHALQLPWSRVFMAVAPLYVLAIALILQVAHMLITSIAG